MRAAESWSFEEREAAAFKVLGTQSWAGGRTRKGHFKLKVRISNDSGRRRWQSDSPEDWQQWG